MNDEQKSIFTLACVIAIFVFAGYALYLFGRADVPTNGNGIDKVRNELNQSENGARMVTEGVGQVRQRLEDVRNTVETNGEPIAECEQILRTVRQRGKKETAAQ